MAELVEAPATPRLDVRCWPAALLALGLFGLYLANGAPLPTGDAKGSSYLGLSLLNDGDLSFRAEEAPFMFFWTAEVIEGQRSVRIDSWQHELGGFSARELFDNGLLHSPKPRYYLVPSREPGVYVNTFGLGAGLCNFPTLAVQRALGIELDHRQVMLSARGTAAFLVAVSVWLVFLVCRFFCGRPQALVLAAAYGLGTCVWSLSSQALWQHGPSHAWGMLALVCFLQARRSTAWAAACGVAVGLAVWCRPTNAVLVLALGAGLVPAGRRALLAFLLAGLPWAILLALSNALQLGSPWQFGQAIASASLAFGKTGSEELWQTPLWLGAAGLLFSPSRGLLIFSPFLGFAGWGVWKIFRAPPPEQPDDAQLPVRRLWPLPLVVLGLWLPAFAWYDWWGGWCFGYRPLLDSVPFLVVLIAPQADALWNRRWLRGLAVALLVWSIGVQILGARSCSLIGWNAFPDIDQPEHRGRLWSLRDSQLLYYLQNFEDGARERKELFEHALASPAT